MALGSARIASGSARIAGIPFAEAVVTVQGPLGDRGLAMTKYLITFPSDAMDHIPQEEIADVAKAAHVCCQELIDAGAYVLAGGLADQPSSIVGTGGAVTDGPRPHVVSGITIVDVPSRDEVAAACHCAQEVREVGPDP
jgi:hypothetical protein